MQTTTRRPTAKPTTRKPTAKPTTRKPTAKPTTRTPTAKPTTRTPTAKPTQTPTRAPTRSPTRVPTAKPTTAKPTSKPTRQPSKKPTASPSSSPTNVSNSKCRGSSSSVVILDSFPFFRIFINFSCLDLQYLQNPSNGPGVTITGQIGVPIVPHSSSTITVILPPSQANKLITMSRVSDDNEDAVPVVGLFLNFFYGCNIM